MPAEFDATYAAHLDQQARAMMRAAWNAIEGAPPGWWRDVLMRGPGGSLMGDAHGPGGECVTVTVAGPGQLGPQVIVREWDAAAVRAIERREGSA